MTTRRELLIALGAGVLAAPLAALAQQAKKIAYLRADAPPTAYIEAFQQGLREHGYVEGKNILVEYRWTDGNENMLRSAAAELIQQKVDLIVASAPAATRAAMDATTTIPIVMVTVADPVAFKFVASLNRPGGNVTGFAFLLPELSGKRLEILKETVPTLSNVGVLWNAANPYKAFDLKEVQLAASVLGVTLQTMPVRTPDDFADAFAAAAKRKTRGLITLDDPFTIAHRARIVELASKHGLPAVYGANPFMSAGGLMFYGPDALDQNRRAAKYVDKILKGAKPGDLPVEQPTRFELVINLKTAKTLGITIPQSIMLQATRVIE